ncbi:MAG TPA: hypothetical protein VII49_00140, partial [Rhizomicrobium sp.]
MRQLAPRESRMVAVGILVAAIAGGWLLLVNPVVEGFSDRANARQTLLETYARNQRILSGI